MTTIDDGVKQTIDLISFSTAMGALMGLLPEIAAIFSIVWSLVRIYESATFQNILSWVRNKVG